MKNYAIFLAIFCVFVACSSKPDEQRVAELGKEILMYSKSARFTQDAENTSFVLFYLNPALENRDDSDIFALLITPKIEDIGAFEVLMDGTGAAVSPLNADDELRRYIPKSDYSDFYKLSLPFKDDSVITLRLCFRGECINLDFQKYSKSLYYRSEDVDTKYD